MRKAFPLACPHFDGRFVRPSGAAFKRAANQCERMASAAEASGVETVGSTLPAPGILFPHFLLFD